MLAWENKLQSVSFQPELREIKQLMSGWSKEIFFEFNKLPITIRKVQNDHKIGKEIEDINLVFPAFKNVERITSLMEDYRKNHL